MHDLLTLHNVVRILWNNFLNLDVWNVYIRLRNRMHRLVIVCNVHSSNILYCLSTCPCLTFPFTLPYYIDYNIKFIIIQFMDVFNVDKMVTKLVESKWGCGSHLMFLFNYKSHASKSQNYTVFHSIIRPTTW